jgi:hypothetical protein
MARAVREILKVVLIAAIKLLVPPPKAGWRRTKRACELETR